MSDYSSSDIGITHSVRISASEVELSAIRSQGAGGQNVNKVSSAIHLRFSVPNSSLPEFYKERLLALKDSRISKEGVLVIKAQRFRTQEKNRADALERLVDLVRSVGVQQKVRRPTRPSKGAKLRRLEGKTNRSKTKALRKSPSKHQL